jgi:hypothetical protein
MEVTMTTESIFDLKPQQPQTTNEITLENIHEKHALLLELKSQLKEVEDAKKALEKEILDFLVNTPGLDGVRTTYGGLKILRKESVTVENKLQLVEQLIGTPYEGLVTVSAQSFPSAFRNDPDFFGQFVEECGIRVTEYSALSVTK